MTLPLRRVGDNSREFKEFPPNCIKKNKKMKKSDVAKSSSFYFLVALLTDFPVLPDVSLCPSKRASRRIPHPTTLFSLKLKKKEIQIKAQIFFVTIELWISVKQVFEELRGPLKR
jgi:hypothetical protein